jgi:hypothetical protein
MDLISRCPADITVTMEDQPLQQAGDYHHITGHPSIYHDAMKLLTLG